MRYKPIDHKDVILRVKEYVWEKRAFRNQNLTAAVVANQIGISRSSLLSIFKSDKNQTFLDYVNDCRVRFSRKMVMNNHSRFSMDHIQALSGFGSLHSFYTKYKERYGELPTVTDARQSKNQ